MRLGNWTRNLRRLRQGAVLLIGGTVVALGVAMIATPGPAVLVIPIGLAILGLEFTWARRWAGLAQRGLGSYRTLRGALGA